MMISSAILSRLPWIPLFLLLALLSASELAAADPVFQFAGKSIALTPAGPAAPVSVGSVTQSAPGGPWTALVTFQNNTGRILEGPFVIVVESFANTAGPLLADGQLAGPARAFYDASRAVVGDASSAAGQFAPGEVSAPFPITLTAGAGTPSVVLSLYVRPAIAPVARAFVRTVSDVGHPLPGVIIEESGPGAVTNRTLRSDARFGVATLGQSPGEHRWRFSKPGYLPVWRSLNLSTSAVVTLASPRLTQQGAASVTVLARSPGSIASADGSILASVPPGAADSTLTVTLTPLGGQNLPALLPLGWSPLQAFHLDLNAVPGIPLRARLRPWDSIAPTETALVVRWNENVFGWEVLESIAGQGTNTVVVSVSRAGGYALVVADTGPGAPPPVAVGAVLPAAAVPSLNLATVRATGRVEPSTSPASRNPEMVTGRASLVLSNESGPMVSGLILPADLTDSYRLNSGVLRNPPRYDHFVIGYQRPGDVEAATLHAVFPLRPLLLFGSEELNEGLVRADILAPSDFAGSLLDARGGWVGRDGVGVLAGQGDVEGEQAALFRSLAKTNFLDWSTNGLEAVAAFEFSIARITSGRSLSMGAAPLPTNGHYLLTRVLYEQGQIGLQPVERFTTDIAGRLIGAEPGSGERLPGLAGSGQFLLLKTPGPLALIGGVARAANGAATNDLLLRVDGQPWLTTSSSNGLFQLVSSTGAVTVAISDARAGDTSSTVLNVPGPLGLSGVTVGASAQAPRVLAVSPMPGSNGVARVSPIIVAFSEPVNPATVALDGVRLLGTNGMPVPASLSLNLRNTAATLLPIDPLAPSTLFTLIVSSNVTDLTGLRIEGPLTFTFTTETDALNRLAGQLTSYEPTNGAAGLVGGPGIAEPESPVILVNETTGYTATILSKPDGSFSNSIPADVDDYLSAVIVNKNGTRNIFPVSRQLFRDGRVGLFNGGGILEAESDGGPVQVIIEPGALKTKTVFQVESLGLSALLSALGGISPSNGTILAGLSIKVEGENTTGEANVSFPFDPVAMGIPDPERAAYAMALVNKNHHGDVAYQVVDRLRPKNGKLTSNTFPFLGFMAGIGARLTMGDDYNPGSEWILVAMVTGLDGLPLAGVVEGFAGVELGVPLYEPLPGAVVMMRPVNLLLGARGRPPKAVQYAVTDAFGRYALLIPRDAGAELFATATHASFKDTPTDPLAPILLDPELSPRTMNFRLTNSSVGQSIRFTIKNNPVHPPIGGPVTVNINASHISGPPTILMTFEKAFERGTMRELELSAVQFPAGGVSFFGQGAVEVRPSNNVALAYFNVRIQATDGSHVMVPWPLRFVGTPPPPLEDLAVVDGSDTSAPSVAAAQPLSGSVLPLGEPIRFYFNEPISKSLLADPTAVTVSGPGSGTVKLGLSLSADQSELSVGMVGLMPGSAYTLHLHPTIVDLATNKLDADVVTEGQQAYEYSFTTGTAKVVPLPGIVDGGGVVVFGSYAYALERSRGRESLRVFDVTLPSVPREVAHYPLPAPPRDLCLIPDFGYHTKPSGMEPVLNRTLLAIVGGDVTVTTVSTTGIEGNALGQFLRILDITDPLFPTRVAGTALSRRNGLTTKVRWQPPLLTYLDSGADYSEVGLIDLAEMLLGFLSLPAEQELFPASRVEGVDANQDGDYVDMGERPPIPARLPTEFFGKKVGYILAGSTQRILDYSWAPPYLGATISGGTLVNRDGSPNGPFLQPAYRTLIYDGNPQPPEAATLTFGTNARPKRVTILNGIAYGTEPVPEKKSIAFVSLTPDDDGVSRLALVDISNPQMPVLLNSIPFGGESLQNLTINHDGLIRIATTVNTLLVDPRLLSLPGNDTFVHPSFVGSLAGAGSGNISLGSSPAGINAVNLGARHELVITAPRLRFVAFPNVGIFDPLGAGFISGTNMGLLMGDAVELSSLPLARLRETGGAVSSVMPPSPASHYYVMVEGPGGGLGDTEIQLGLEALNRSGFPYKNMGWQYPPVRALKLQSLTDIGQTERPDCDATITGLKARRMSDDPKNPFYNRYLSQPFALISETIDKDELATIVSANGVTRHILWGGFRMRAFLDRDLVHPEMKAFEAAADLAAKLMVPRASVVADTVSTPYILGPNPLPPNSQLEVPGTFGTISAQNGQFMNDTVDMALPGRRLPVVFQRSIRGQDRFDGPFGPGWDHVYNQQMIHLAPGTFPAGRSLPLIVRELAADTTRAEAGDVIFQTGQGRVILFKNKGQTAPVGIVDDPLVAELDWLAQSASYFLPDVLETGVFDILMQFKGGQFVRLTPDGMQYWYSKRGRFEKIYHRHSLNWQELSYNERGELIRITDRSTTEDRFVEIGYYRRQSDPLYQPLVDSLSEKPFTLGHIASLRDFTAAKSIPNVDVQFKYSDDGVLSERLGPEAGKPPGTTAAPNAFIGRARTIYLADPDCAGAVKGIVAGNGSSDTKTPLFAATLSKEGVASEGQGAGGSITYTAPINNKAGVPDSITSAAGSDGDTEFKFDKFGYAKAVNLKGKKGKNPADPEANHQINYTNGLLVGIALPLGNVVTNTYALDHLVFRSRGNLLRRELLSGPPPNGQTKPPPIVTTFNYDSRYNLPSGEQTDANGKTVTYTLTDDGREIKTIDYGGAATASFTYNTSGQVLLSTSPDGVKNETMYHDAGVSEGFKMEETRGKGASPEMKILFSYDFSRAGLLGIPTTVTVPVGAATIVSTYDNRIQLRKVTRGELQEERSYDENGNVISLKRKLSDNRYYEEERAYNQINFLTKTTVKKVETDGVERDLVTTFTPDPAWRILRVDLPGGEIRTNAYNHLGHLVATGTWKAGGGALIESSTLDLHGKVLEVRRGTVHGGATETTKVQSLGYDGFDRLIAVTRHVSSAAAQVARYEYLPGGQQKRATVEEANGTIVSETLIPGGVADVDALGRILKSRKIGSDLQATVSSSFAPNGLSATVLGPRSGYSATTMRDVAGRTVQTVNPLATVDAAFDGNGNLLSSTANESGATRAFVSSSTYDDLDHVSQASDGEGLVASFVNRIDGKATTITDGLGRVTANSFSVLGELTGNLRPASILHTNRFDKNRQQSFEGDKTLEGHAMAHDDGTLRLTRKKLRAAGAVIEYNKPNALNLPEEIVFPGGSRDVTYDFQGRLTSDSIDYESGSLYRIQGMQHDALNRVKAVEYGSSAQFSAAYTYDKLGPVRSATYDEAMGSFTVNTDINPDGSRKTFGYPSGISLGEARDVSGRLERVTKVPEILCQVDTYAGANLPGQISFGNGLLRQENHYDLRKRLVARQYRRTADNTVLADLRYEYDAANNVRVRQQVHRQGRADIFSYDPANRLTRAEIGARPLVAGAVRSSAGGLTGDFGLVQPMHGRTYAYDAGGLDLLLSATDLNPEGFSLPLFAGTRSGHDDYLHAGLLDGSPRARDALGNTTQTRLAVRPSSGGSGPVLTDASLTYNGLSQLTRVEFLDGRSIEYQYRPDGIMHHRVVKQGDDVLEETGFVYFEGLLLEERAATGLKTRYYYNDEDVPFAMDRVGVGVTNRFYFLKDALGSVVAVANSAGQVVERVNYDAWGQPEIQAQDVTPPVVASISDGGSGQLLVRFSERVLPPLVAAAAPALVKNAVPLAAAQFQLLNDLGEPVLQDSPIYEEDLVSGAGFGTTIRLKPRLPLPANVTLRVAAGALRDEWGNANAELTVPFLVSGGTNRYHLGAVTDTAPPVLARSAIGSALLFHGQWYDYDAGLSYMRARFYDPYGGQFLQRDPLEYEDSVNQFAAFANSPQTLRDPTGTDAENYWQFAMDFGSDLFGIPGIISAAKSVKERSDEIGRALGDARPGDALALGLYVDAVAEASVALGDRVSAFSDGGANLAEIGVLLMGDALGVNALKEAQTGDSIFGDPLSDIERGERARDGAITLIGAVTGGVKGLSGLTGRGAGAAAVSATTTVKDRVLQTIAKNKAARASSRYAAKTTGTVWDSVKATQPLYEGTAIPRSFELATGNSKVWVHGNATEHMAEYATSMLNRGVSPSMVNMGTQAQMTSLQSAVNAATANGVQYNKLLNVGGWELKFGAPQQAGQLPALIHALPR